MSSEELPGSGHHIETCQWQDYFIDIYDPDDIFAAADERPVDVFVQTDFNSPLESATIAIKGHDRVDNARAYVLDGKIIFDRNLADVTQLTGRLLSRFRNLSTVANLQFSPTSFSNVFNVVDENSGLRTLAVIKEDGEVRLCNEVVVKGIKTSEIGAIAVAPSREEINYTEALKGFSQIVLGTLDMCNETDYSKPLPQSYNLGLNLINNLLDPFPRPAVSLGGTAVKANDQPSEDIEATQLSRETEFVEQKTRLEDVGGLDDVKRQLREIALSFRHPEIMEKWAVDRPQGILLYGEPGTGKTMLVDAFASEAGANLWRIKSTEIHESPLGNSEANIQAIFDQAKAMKDKTILFFDEFEAVISVVDSPGPGGADHAKNAVAAIFKQEMNSLTKENPNLIVVAATNKLDRIDSSLIRPGRFDIRLYVQMPDKASREQIFTSIIANCLINAEDDFIMFDNDVSLDELAEATDGMSGADINEILRRVRFDHAMQEAQAKQAHVTNYSTGYYRCNPRHEN
jgi:ATP-dependent 26S proteasome regulatory subunit